MEENCSLNFLQTMIVTDTLTPRSDKQYYQNLNQNAMLKPFDFFLTNMLGTNFLSSITVKNTNFKSNFNNMMRFS